MSKELRFTQDDLESVIKLYVEYERVHDYQSVDATRMAINDVIEGRLALNEFASELAPVANEDELESHQFAALRQQYAKALASVDTSVLWDKRGAFADYTDWLEVQVLKLQKALETLQNNTDDQDAS